MTRTKLWRCKNRKCPEYGKNNCGTYSNTEPENTPCVTGSTPENLQYYQWEWDGEYIE
jgi:hypothetical protein